MRKVTGNAGPCPFQCNLNSWVECAPHGICTNRRTNGNRPSDQPPSTPPCTGDNGVSSLQENRAYTNISHGRTAWLSGELHKLSDPHSAQRGRQAATRTARGNENLWPWSWLFVRRRAVVCTKERCCLCEGELGRKFNGCWLFILVLCDLRVYYHDGILKRVSPARADADRHYDSTQDTNQRGRCSNHCTWSTVVERAPPLRTLWWLKNMFAMHH